MPQKAFLGDEDAGAREDIRPFDFQLARELGKTLTELADMPEREYQHWYRFLSVEASAKEMHERAAAARMRG
jgi:hypothetical protein